MKTVTVVIGFMLIFSVLTTTDVQGQAHQPENAYLFLLDTGPVNLDAKLGFQVRVEAMRVIRGLRHQVRYVRSRVELIDITEGRLVWAGTPGTLMGAEADKVTKAISIKPKRCSDLVTGFDALQHRVNEVEKMGFTKIHITILSPLINTGRPCSEKTIKLPQAPPAFDFFGSLVKSLKTKSILFYFVHFQQKRIWGKAGIFLALEKWAEEEGRTFKVFEQSESLQEISNNMGRIFQ